MHSGELRLLSDMELSSPGTSVLASYLATWPPSCCGGQLALKIDLQRLRLCDLHNPVSVCRPFYLHVVYYTHADDTEDTAGQLRTLLDQYTSRGLQSNIIPGPGDFSRGRGLELGAELVKDENALLFFVDVDMLVSGLRK